jgi:hypothetical protein
MQIAPDRPDLGLQFENSFRQHHDEIPRMTKRLA